jgi:hypothetical protein
MQSAVPVKSFSPFNIFNIVALVAILVIGYFLYKKFTEKFNNGAINVEPTKTHKEPVSIVAQEAEISPPADDSTPKK